MRDWALRAVSLEQERNGASLNTLACVYARAGKGGEAMQFLLKSLEAGQDESSATWYAAGLIAEDLGLPEEVLRLYGRVQKPKEDSGLDDSWTLTQPRIAELEEGGEEPRHEDRPAVAAQAASEEVPPSSTPASRSSASMVSRCNPHRGTDRRW